MRAGHAALVLIDKATGILEYHDFGRYITPEPYGRVRGKDTDNELDFPLKAIIKNNSIVNLEEILKFLATHPKLTHGDGKLIASVCNAVDYKKARTHITELQQQEFIRYAAFIKDACNCARFVTDAVIASTTNADIKKQLVSSKWFTPSTVGNVMLSDTEDYVFSVTEKGEISKFNGSQKSENIRCFLDRLKGYEPSLEGTLIPKPVSGMHENAQWLSGIAAGAWYTLDKTPVENLYRYKRISPYGNIDVDDVFEVLDTTFNYHADFKFVHYSNCSFFRIEQNNTVYKFTRKN